MLANTHTRVFLGLTAFACFIGLQVAHGETGKDILRATGFRGGLVVHIGCGDGRMTASLHGNDHTLVHGLETHAQDVAKARETIQSLGLYGPVSIGRFDGTHLPYAENLVNLIVAEELGGLSKDELLRVLAPNGIAYIKSGDQWTTTVKPWPEDIDEWTHWLHSADGNAVARDRVVGPPRHLQWAAAPRWQRHHNTVPSTTGMVSARGRLFYISDEAPPGLDPAMPDRWFLVARDAFNGVLLWKRPMAEWGWNQWNTEWLGRFNTPPHLPKRLVAAGDRVYATLNFNAPLTALDAATGAVLRTYPGTENTDEILHKDGLLILSLNEETRRPRLGQKKPVKKSVCALDAKSGEMLWKKGPFSGLRGKSAAAEPFGRLELIAGGNQVCLVDHDAIISLDLATGAEMWRTPRPAFEDKVIDKYSIRYTDLCVLVYQDGVVLYAQPDMVARVWHSFPGELYAFDAKTGEQLWHRPYGGWSHNWQPDVFVVDGMVWIHDHTVVDQPDWNTGHREDKSGIDYFLIGLDLKTGELKRKFSTNKAMHVDHHHRCYRAKATERFFLASRRGVEFLDFETGENTLNHWTRGACLHGIVPSNGLLYLTPHPCRCYVETQLNGYFGLAPRASRMPLPSAEQSGRKRLEKGPAYRENQTPRGTSHRQDEWPTFRHDPLRSGGTATPISKNLSIAWRTEIGGHLSPPVIAGGKVFVTSIDEHRVVALNADSGEQVWDYTAGGRIDTPPTLYRGLVLFGSADGGVYCLTEADGRLAWRFQAAPGERLVVAYGQLESAWPVRGSILIEDDRAYVTAGRSSYLDGGFALYVLNPTTGEMIEKRTLYSPDPETDEMQKPTYNRKIIPGTLSDILVSDGSSIFMRQERVFGEEPVEKKHLFSTAGLRDSSWFDRTFWAMGKTEERASSRLIVFDDKTVYGITEAFGKKISSARTGDSMYQLFAEALEPGTVAKLSYDERKAEMKKKPKRRWTVSMPLRVTAMVVAGRVLVAAGTPATVAQPDPLGMREGRHGAGLWLLSTEDGSKLAAYDLDAAPVLDGIAVTEGRVYIAAANGELLCFRADN